MIIPDDVKSWVRSVFRACNVCTAERLMTMPNTHETALDQAFITEAAKFSAPVRLPSTWIVRIDTHFLGGGRHFNEWEVADIGVLIQFRCAGKLVKSKVLLLQSKRLYPTEQDFDEDEPEDYRIGFMRLFREDTSFGEITKVRKFRFEDTSRNQALKVDDRQYKVVAAYEKQHKIPVCYLLYHPGVVPFEAEIPRTTAPQPMSAVEIGARVLPAHQLHKALKGKPDGYVPKYADVKGLKPSPKIEGG